MRVEHIKRRVSEQMLGVDTIKHSFDLLMKIGRENISRQRIETRLDALTEEWEKFRVNHLAIILALQKINTDERRSLIELPYFQEGLYDSTHDQYLDWVEKMTSLLSDLNDQQEVLVIPTSSARTSQIAPSRRQSYSEPRLPRLPLPQYDGKHESWLPFRDQFESMVVNNQTISAVEKLQYLKCSLVGPAAQMLESTTLTASNFIRAWESLIALYENPRQLINASVDCLLDVSKVKNESSEELVRLFASISQTRQNLQNLKCPVDQWDHLWVRIVVRQKLDLPTVQAWEMHLGETTEPPSWNKLQSFIQTRIRTLQAVEKSKVQATQSTSGHRHQGITHFRRPSFKAHFASQVHNNKKPCSVCSDLHYTSKCPEFKAKPIQQRLNIVNKEKLCFNCLGRHTANLCQSTVRCFTCGRKHHTLLHQEKSTANHNTNQSTSESPKQVHHIHHGRQDNPFTNTTVLLATARVKVISNHGETILARVLLDQGSEISLVSESLIQRLHIQRRSSSVPILGIGAQKSGRTKGIVSLIIQPHFNSAITVRIDAHILPKLTSTIPSARIIQQRSIDIIIGADVYGQLLEGPIIKGPSNSPTAQSTKLGWIISGPTHCAATSQDYRINHYSIDHDLYSLLERFWHQEEIHSPMIKTLSSMDQECENHFFSTHSRDEKGRYIVRLPFKISVNQIGNSRPSAVRMLNHLFKKFESNQTYYDAYSSFVKEYELLHHMNQVQDTDGAQASPFFLPHHGVIRESSSTTKLRVVFNGSCKVTEGISLNEALHAGPKRQIDIFDVLLWLRQFLYIFSSDIEKMYRQILVHPDDQKFQRILWKQDNKIIEYQLATVTYGLACAPFLALRSILQLIEDEGYKFPLAVNTLLKGRYVDDIFGGADSIEEAQQLADQVNKLCMAGGFPLRKWISNNSQILNLIPSNHHLNTDSILIKDQVVHALGLSWTPAQDAFHFKLSSSPEVSSITKRKVLSEIAQFFDPLGFLSPLFIKSKIFMQELWAIKLDWDDCLADPQLRTWQLLVQSLEGLEEIRIPRWLGTTSQCSIEIHGFSDASQLAMAAVVYIKTTHHHNEVKTSILCSKSKVAPLKRMTIPRLELSAAVMLTKLTHHCIQTLNIEQAPCYLWTDSSIVHTWINNHPSRWKEFIHNRVCFIQETLPNAKWRHVPGTENPADCATRGLTAAELQKHSLWWNGPSWLTEPASRWPTSSTPTSPSSSDNLEERTKTAISLLATKEKSCWDLLDKYSSLHQLLKITIFCQRAGRNKSFRNLTASTTPEELINAQYYWIKSIQQQHFGAEIKLLLDKKELPKSSSIIRLIPFVDYQGLLRVGGRLKNSALPASTKHPVILPSTSPLSILIIQDAHQRTCHGSTQETLSFVRTHYWILGGRSPVRSFILKCVKCTRYRRNQAQHLMGQLPPERVTPSRAFLHTGVDYAGPFNLRNWRGKKSRTYKAWVSLFVCFSTSAIHLEIVTDYTTDAFLAAYKRFVSRRGICATLHSDCGTNFQGSNKELKNLFFQSSQELGKLTSVIAHDGTKWEFNPPAAPHFGGKWEAGVKSMKYHLRRVVGDTLLTFEEFSTVLCQIEAVLNSRPLCPLTDDPDDIDVLTPGHFLIGHQLNLVPEPNLQHIQSSRLSRWQQICQMTQSFWSKWSKEYLQRYQSVYKWNSASTPLTEGSLVLITDERYPPAKWPLGRILKLHVGADKIARVAQIKTASTTLTRPIVKLCPLNIQPAPGDCSLSGSTKAGGKC